MYSMPNRIRQCRIGAGMSQSQLAVKIGIKRSAVAQWEQSNGTSPNVDNLVKTAIATGVLFEWLATGRGPRRPSGSEFVEAVVANEFARDEMENRLLMSVRQMSHRNRILACRIVELIAS
jgi:transcriptional regulator with XRE-family HTH domain